MIIRIKKEDKDKAEISLSRHGIEYVILSEDKYQTCGDDKVWDSEECDHWGHGR